MTESYLLQAGKRLTHVVENLGKLASESFEAGRMNRDDTRRVLQALHDLKGILVILEAVDISLVRAGFVIEATTVKAIEAERLSQA